MSIRILVNGATGKMGRLTVTTLGNQTEFSLVGQTGSQDDLRTEIQSKRPDVVVDFTRPESVYQNTLTIMEAGARPVIGTTGLTLDQIADLQKRATTGGIIAPNFSLGAILMMKCAQEIAQYLHHAEIIEMHHDGKVDSPSGTALRTADILNTAATPLNQPVRPQKETVAGARGARHGNIPIHAVRLPGLLAHQQILFGGTGETLTIRHDALDRQCFMPGVLLACRRVMELNDLIYGLEQIL